VSRAPHLWRLAGALSTLAASAAAQTPAAPVAQAPTICGSSALCYEASDFAATITDFRTSMQGPYHIIDVTVRFTNKTAAPLILGYANGSGMATDDRGNRYALGGGNALRGMGVVNGQSFDPKFQINAGGYGDSRFELLLQGSPQVIGFAFELDLAVNEINSYQGNQHTLGGEFPLMWKGLQNGASGAAPGQVAYSNAGSVASVPCTNTTVQNAATGAQTTVANVSTAVASIGSIFGKKQPAAASAPTVPCTAPQGMSAAAPAAPNATGTPAAPAVATTSAAPVKAASPPPAPPAAATVKKAVPVTTTTPSKTPPPTPQQ
jgi:hypothetical protein